MTRYYLPLSLPDLPSEMLPRSSAVIQSQNYLHLRLHHKRKFADAIPFSPPFPGIPMSFLIHSVICTRSG